MLPLTNVGSQVKVHLLGQKIRLVCAPRGCGNPTPDVLPLLFAVCVYFGGCTAEQGLIASVRGGQWTQALQPLVQNSTQMASVAKAADGDAVQVHGLHKVAQQRPLQAQDVPSEEEMETSFEGGRDVGRQSKGTKYNPKSVKTSLSRCH